jgi:polar amino acid transport system substrate-binding protein
MTAFLAIAVLLVTACGGGVAVPTPGSATPTSAAATLSTAATSAAPSPTATTGATPTASASPSAVATTTAATSASPTASPTASASASPSASVGASPAATVSAECLKLALTTLTSGKLTIGADNPAFPPYYQGDPPDPAWEFGNPNNGKGLEGATAYAVARALGYEQADVTWVAVPFNNATQPGKKAFDLYLTQVSYSAERAEVVDLSEGYFDVSQSVLALKDSEISKVTDVAGLEAFKLGTQAGTTSYSYITDQIQPTPPPMAYDSMTAALAALKAKQIQGIVADLPTAFFMRDAPDQLNGEGVIVGSLPTVGTPEHFSILLTKDSPLTACVNQALASIKADGTLQAIVDEWITGQGAPVLE